MWPFCHHFGVFDGAGCLRGQWWLQAADASNHFVKIFEFLLLTLRTSESGISTLRKLPCGVESRYTGGTVCQRQASEAAIPALFSNAYWRLNAPVIEIQTRQQLKNNLSHEIQRIFVNKFCI